MPTSIFHGLTRGVSFLESRRIAGMGNHEILTAFEVWMGSSDRSDGTIQLRMRYMRELASTHELLEVTVYDLEAIMARRRALADNTRKSQLSSWRLFYGWAHRRGIRLDNPTADLESIRVKPRDPRVAPDDDVQRAIERATPIHRAMVMLARYACLRLTELTTLPLTAREGEWLRVIGKGDKERVVGINEPLMFALHALECAATGSQYYFPGQRTPHMHPMSVNKIITRITGWNPHSLRHAGATAAYNETHNLEGVRDMLGHASIATTQRYLHIGDETRRAVAAATVIRPRMPIAA